MFLKNNRYVNYLCIIIFLNFSNNVEANTKIKILDYLNSLKYFSASFIQNDGENLSEGKVYIGEKRVRAVYLYPSKILIVLDEDEFMKAETSIILLTSLLLIDFITSPDFIPATNAGL